MKLAVISCLLLKITFSETWEEMNRHLQLGSIWKLAWLAPSLSLTPIRPLRALLPPPWGSLELNKEEPPQSLGKFEKCLLRKLGETEPHFYLNWARRPNPSDIQKDSLPLISHMGTRGLRLGKGRKQPLWGSGVCVCRAETQEPSAAVCR